MQVEQTGLCGVVLITPTRLADHRGSFSEVWNARSFARHGIDTAFVQDNQSVSHAAGTLRGLHFQAPPHAQAKLVRCLRGALFDVAVDARHGSPTFGHWVGYDLTPENGRQLYIPEGVLHGFITRTPDTEIAYKCSAHYNAAADGAVAWDSCGIDWGQHGTPILSDKDANAAPFGATTFPFQYIAAA